MRTVLLKDLFREIRYSLPRFLSIMLMISLGVFVYSGLKGAAPLMRNTLNDFTQKTNMADLKIETILGLERKDISLILSNTDIVDAEFHYLANLNTIHSDLLIQLQSLPKTISTPFLVKGRYPKLPNEILLDNRLQIKNYQIGDLISFKKENNKFNVQLNEESNVLKRYQFKVVGFCYHPEFIHPHLKNEADDGLGNIEGFGFILEKNFNLSNYRFARIKLQNTNHLLSEDINYKAISTLTKEKLSLALDNRPKIRLHNLKKKARDKIRENEKKLIDARQQLEDTKNYLLSAEKKLLEGEEKLKNEKSKLNAETRKAEITFQNAEIQLNLSKETLNNGQLVYQQKQEEFKNARQQYEIGYSSFENGKIKLTQKEMKLHNSQKQIQEGIVQIDIALADLIHSEKELLSVLPRLGIPVDVFKLNVLSAVQTNNQSLLQSMGKIAINYATILQTRQQLIKQKNKLQEDNNKVLSGLEILNIESAKLRLTEAELAKAKKELDMAERALATTKSKLDTAQFEYENGLQKLQSSKDMTTLQLNQAQIKIATAEKELQTAWQKYENNKKEFEKEETKANEKIENGKEKIEDAKKIIKLLKEPAYKVQTREDIEHYFIYLDSAKRMELLANIFPVFFFLIAMLVCLSTMTRMAEEHRGQIGTLKALGYSNWAISKKYFYYGLLSSLLGGIIGVSLGQPILSRVVYAAYNDSFIIKKPLFKMSWQYNISSVLIGIACTAIVAFFVVNKHLHQNAALLMRPKSPQSGTKIALEQIGFIWKRMSFLQKVTARNMFRYKVRMLMAVLGISGCTSLVFLGFSLRDSVSHLLPVQFGEITHYQYLVIYDEDLGKDSTKKFQNYLDSTSIIQNYATLHLESMTWKKSGLANQNVQIIVPQNPSKFTDIQTLRDPKNNHKILPLPKEGAIVTNKLAKLANIKVGDKIEMVRDDNKRFQIPVVSVSENYLGHYLYMSKDYYIRQFGKNPIWNTKAIVLNSPDTSASNSMASELLDFDVVLSVTETNFASAVQNLESLDVVVGIMILLSSLLAFVVLYNLSNINISERMRELSTIKVLGFFPKELTAYVYRETFSLSFIGIGIGYISGVFLHKMILEVIVPDAFQLYPKIFPLTYIIAAVMTLVFSIIVMIFVHFRLKHIDMVQALKSYE